MTMTDPAPESDRDRILRMISHRCPELLPADLALIADAPVDSDDRLPMAIGEQILDVVLALEDRMTALEQAVRGG
jgi:hypothetical protein